MLRKTMFRKSVTTMTGMFAVLMLAAFGRASHAQGMKTINAAGGFLYNGSYVAPYISAQSVNGVDSGTLALTFGNARVLAVVSHIDWVSPNETHLFAQVCGKAATLEIDLYKNGAQNMIAFRETDNTNNQTMKSTGTDPNQALKPIPMLGRITVSGVQ